MKKYTKNNFKKSKKTLMKFLMERIEYGLDIYPDEDLLNKAKKYYIKNTTSKNPKSNMGKIKREMARNYITLAQNMVINKIKE